MRQPRREAAKAPLFAAVSALTIEDLDDDEVTGVGVLRAVLNLVNRAVTAAGGYPSDVAAKHTAIHHSAVHSARLAREALAVWEEVVPDPDPEDVPPF